jgi:hypothetical protein
MQEAMQEAMQHVRYPSLPVYGNALICTDNE